MTAPIYQATIEVQYSLVNTTPGDRLNLFVLSGIRLNGVICMDLYRLGQCSQPGVHKILKFVLRSTERLIFAIGV